jgi:NAD(P)-dependent dehydrogenase (short-subunit alcohol dehydrogenase family)
MPVEGKSSLKLTDKRAVITGASHGLGHAIARTFLLEGARVMICGRSADALDKACSDLQAIAPGRVHATVCDVAVPSDVEELARQAEKRLGGVDILVANAGIYGPKGLIEDVEWSQWLETIQVNLIGSAYCCRVFIPILKRASRGKIVILSGGGATKPMPFLSAYAASKAGVVRLGETLAEELKPFGIDVNLVAPGALNTRMLDEILEAGPEKVGEAYYQTAVKQRDGGGIPLEYGANLCVHLASRAGDGVSGRLISAQWDPWPRIEELRDELMASDIYTLRRIVPAERGKDWDRP